MKSFIRGAKQPRVAPASNGRDLRLSPRLQNVATLTECDCGFKPICFNYLAADLKPFKVAVACVIPADLNVA